MARKTIQAPILTYMLHTNRPIKRGELVEAIGGSSSSISGALSRLKGNGVVQRNEDGTWEITNAEEAQWLTQHTYHTKTRKEATAAKPTAIPMVKPVPKAVKAANAAATQPRVVGVMDQPSASGSLRMGDLFEMIGRLPDGSNLVRTLETAVVYKLEEV